KLLSARATTFSVCAGVKYENASIFSPVDGFTVANPALFMFAPCRCLSSTIESERKLGGGGRARIDPNGTSLDPRREGLGPVSKGTPFLGRVLINRPAEVRFWRKPVNLS